MAVFILQSIAVRKVLETVASLLIKSSQLVPATRREDKSAFNELAIFVKNLLRSLKIGGTSQKHPNIIVFVRSL